MPANRLSRLKYLVEVQRLDMNTESSIPLINFGHFLNGSTDERSKVASSIDAAFRSVGFVYLSNHGMDQEKVYECFQWVRRLAPSLQIPDRRVELKYVVIHRANVSSTFPNPRRT